MNRIWIRTNTIKIIDDSLQCGCRVPKNATSCTITSFLAGLLGIITTLPLDAYAQTLDDAIKAQLNLSGIPCRRLLDSNPSNTMFLTGQLKAICRRDSFIGGAGPSTISTGGGAGTPTTLPSIVQQRLREAGGKESKPKSGGAASADHVAKFESGLSLFISGEFESLKRDVTTFEDGFDSKIRRVVAGADYHFTNQFQAGLAYDYYKHKGDFDGGGDFNNDSHGVLVFGSFLPIDQVFVQLSAGYARKTYDRERFTTFIEINADGTTNFDTTRVGTIVNGEYNADETSVSALAGYHYPIGNVTISPRAGLDFYNIDYENYSETGGTGLELTFHDDDQTSLQTRVGAQASVAFKTGFGMIVPQASFDWKHEFKNDQRNVEVSFVGDTRAKRFTYQTQSPDRDWFEINAGMVAVVGKGVQLFGNYRTIIGHNFFDSHAGTIGLHIEF